MVEQNKTHWREVVLYVVFALIGVAYGCLWAYCAIETVRSNING